MVTGGAVRPAARGAAMPGAADGLALAAAAPADGRKQGQGPRGGAAATLNAVELRGGLAHRPHLVELGATIGAQILVDWHFDSSYKLSAARHQPCQSLLPADTV